MDSETRNLLRGELSVPDARLGTLARERRLATIHEAMMFPSGTGPGNQARTILYDLDEGLQIALGKPGKESLISGDRHNPYDMTPQVLVDGVDTGYRPAFRDIYRALQETGTSARSDAHSGLEVLAAILFRNAFVLDHAMGDDGAWRYSPPSLALSYIDDNCREIDGMPARVFLHLIEALALNEDVKYFHRNGDQLTDVGRQNNLLTCVNMALVFLGKVELFDFAGALSRTGVAPVSQKAAKILLPLLVPPSGETAVEQPVLDAIGRMTGKSAVELATALGARLPSPTNKSFHVSIVRRALKSAVGDELWSRLKQDYNIKCVRVDRAGTPVEDISFDASTTAVAHETWESSTLRRLWARPFLFIIFDSSPPTHTHLVGAAFTELPEDELEGAARVSWEIAATRLKMGSREALPKASDSPFFVRNKASHKTMDESGETTTPLAFWLDRAYVASLIAQSSARIAGATRGT